MLILLKVVNFNIDQFIEAPKELHLTIFLMLVICVIHMIMSFLSWNVLYLSKFMKKVIILASIGWCLFRVWGLANVIYLSISAGNYVLSLMGDHLLIVHSIRVIIYAMASILLYQAYNAPNKSIKIIS